MVASFFTPLETDNKGKAGFFLNYDMDAFWMNYKTYQTYCSCKRNSTLKLEYKGYKNSTIGLNPTPVS